MNFSGEKKGVIDAAKRNSPILAIPVAGKSALEEQHLSKSSDRGLYDYSWIDAGLHSVFSTISAEASICVLTCGENWTCIYLGILGLKHLT